jgi:hypothetical protein
MTSSRLIVVSLLFLAHTSIGSAQELSVRLADVRNGRPFPNQTVTIQYRKIVGGSATFETFTIRTDSNGSASFQLPTPVPPKINVTAYDLYPCYSLLPIDTQQLWETGIASHCSKSSQGCRCKFSKEADRIKAKAGEIVLLARPTTRWERFREHIWE